MLNRRELLCAGAAVGLGAAAPAAARQDVACIFVVCTGGPSQLDTWDPKPEAPAEVRGPYRAVRTAIPGVRFAETLPGLAALANRFSVIRTLCHDGDDLHETGLQRIQTGRAFGAGPEWPHFGAVAAMAGGRGGLPAHIVLPTLGDTGVSLPHGQAAGFLGRRHEPLRLDLHSDAPILAAISPDPRGTVDGSTGCDPAEGELEPAAASAALRGALEVSREPEVVRSRYGQTSFGTSLLTARRLVERGARVVTVNHAETLFGRPTWDCHGYPDLPTRVADLGDQVARPFDQAMTTLIRDLMDRGLWHSTVVCCVGEFGRTPMMTAAGGRDHWTRCWSALVGGGPLRAGLVIGESDARAAEPRDRPVSPAELVATLYAALGHPNPTAEADGRQRPLLPANTHPLRELL